MQRSKLRDVSGRHAGPHDASSHSLLAGCSIRRKLAYTLPRLLERELRAGRDNIYDPCKPTEPLTPRPIARRLA
eukprot:6190592-Pleurochrysis_carterae.AAC.2